VVAGAAAAGELAGDCAATDRTQAHVKNRAAKKFRQFIKIVFLNWD
jgi:hypothetical protein